MTAEGIAATLTGQRDGYARLDAAALAANYAEDCVIESPIPERHVDLRRRDGLVATLSGLTVAQATGLSAHWAVRRSTR